MTSNTINNDVTMQPGAEGTLLAGRYRVVRQLGVGGMGSVWLAEDTQLDNKQFAIKMLPSILVSNKRAYRQLKDEALVAMRLVHPNIVQIRAFEENNGNPFLVMDYIDGQTLDDYLAEKGALSEGDTIKLLKPIAAALDYAHGEGVVHRDVKPANVMIRKDGHPFILDFGISREMQETMTRVTGKLSSGTLLYMSPEQLHGASPKKEQDVYSFAAMAYECLKGEPPFSRGQIEFQIDNDTPEPLLEGTCAASIMSGLAKKPEARPLTCVAVLSGAMPRCVERAENDEGEAWSNGGVGKSLGVLALLAVLAGGAYYAWTKYDEDVKNREAEMLRANEARIARLKEEKDAIEADRRKIEAEREKLDAKHAEERAGLENAKTTAEQAADSGGVSIAEQEARQKGVARLAELHVDIGIKVDDAREKMSKIAAYRGEPDGFKSHIDTADAKWKVVNAVDTKPATVVEAEAALKLVSDAESAIARELRWLETNKSARDGAKTIEAEIVRTIDPELTRFNANDYARVAFMDGDALRKEGNSALAQGDFQKADEKLQKAKERLLVSVSEAKSFCIETHLNIAQKWKSASKWQQCIEECDMVLVWDASNETAKKLKPDAQRNLIPSARVVATINGREVDGAKLNDGTKSHVTPINLTLEDGRRYGPYEVSYESGGHRYFGTLKDFTARPGKQEFKVNLEERFYPSVRLVATVNGQAKRAYVFDGADKQGVYTPTTIELVNTQIGAERKFGVVYTEGGVVYRRIQGYLVKDGKHDFAIEMKPLHKCSSCGWPLPKYLSELKCSHCGYKFMP